MKKILIANRGEIACRIIRSAKEMGIKTVAIYSEADRLSTHTRMADEAVCIGPPPSNLSYLDGAKIINVAKNVKADAIHPGYGFLSENADFAAAVENAGILFVGPSSKSIATMGNKLAAKEAVKQYNIPLVPGTDKPIKHIREARAIAKKIGFPILVKAAGGGGGKGMRVVNKSTDLEEQLERAISEAKSAFGDGSVFIEKYITSPRHIEIQILGDQHGNIIHLFERECSIQRRHQKVVEEAPSSILTSALREAMGQSAIDVARSCNYVGAGTVEFIVDEDLNYYFLEMNTRLQVEHPVTELITGIDLVKEQISIAQGHQLGIAQNDLTINGHAMEVRVYAEDPTNNFLPDVGKLERYKVPKGPGVRVDDGFEEGMDIPIHYDPMIAKLVTHGTNRDAAIHKMIRAIEEYQIVGVKTTLAFGKFVMQHPIFKKGTFNTHFIEEHFSPEQINQHDKLESKIAGAIAAYLYQSKKLNYNKAKQTMNETASAWVRNRKEKS